MSSTLKEIVFSELGTRDSIFVTPPTYSEAVTPVMSMEFTTLYVMMFSVSARSLIIGVSFRNANLEMSNYLFC